MKTSESHHESSDQNIDGSARLSQAQLFDQMRKEFHDFVAQTRERLRLVSDSLAELDQHYVGMPSASCGNGLDETDSPCLVVDPLATCDEEPANWFGDAKADASNLTDQPMAPVDFPLESNVETPTQSERASIASKDAMTDVTFPGPSSSKCDSPANSSSGLPIERTSPTRPQQDDTQSDTDPFERLKAIKERLARQIEKT